MNKRRFLKVGLKSHLKYKAENSKLCQFEILHFFQEITYNITTTTTYVQKRLREVEDPEKRPKPSSTLTSSSSTTIVEQLVATALVGEQIPCWAL